MASNGGSLPADGRGCASPSELAALLEQQAEGASFQAWRRELEAPSSAGDGRLRVLRQRGLSDGLRHAASLLRAAAGPDAARAALEAAAATARAGALEAADEPRAYLDGRLEALAEAARLLGGR